MEAESLVICPHLPVRVLERLLRSDVAHLVYGELTEWPARSGEQYTPDVIALFSVDALEYS